MKTNIRQWGHQEHRPCGGELTFQLLKTLHWSEHAVRLKVTLPCVPPAVRPSSALSASLVWGSPPWVAVRGSGDVCGVLALAPGSSVGDGARVTRLSAAPLHLSPFSPPDGDRRVDPPALSGRVPGLPGILSQALAEPGTGRLALCEHLWWPCESQDALPLATRMET